ncbi:MAG: universal stress protein [Halalkalicoccus sp.]|nr:universal stress protein [Halalkalicoccus sp.]
MISRVLVAMDDSEMAERALEFAFEAHPDSEITVLSVVGVPSWFMGEAVGLSLSEDLPEAAEEHAQRVLDRAREIAAEHDRGIDTAVALGSPSRAIVERAEGFDVVVVGSHGRDLSSRLLIGNTAETVVRRSPVPVTVVR